MPDLRNITHADRMQFLDTASAVVREVAKKYSVEDAEKGGYCRVFVLPTLPFSKFHDLLQFNEGWVGGASNREKFNKYWNLSIEKAQRLAAYAQYGAISSWVANRNPEKDQYGGAILMPCAIPQLGSERVWTVLSFSGLPEVCDEAAMLLTAVRMGWAGEKEIMPIISVSKNNFALNLF